jgi:hypothetical protein
MGYKVRTHHWHDGELEAIDHWFDTEEEAVFFATASNTHAAKVYDDNLELVHSRVGDENVSYA